VIGVRMSEDETPQLGDAVRVANSIGSTSLTVSDFSLSLRAMR